MPQIPLHPIIRNGKIARIPLCIREELNRRLDNDEQGIKLVAWLNTLPEVQAVLKESFGGYPISEQNLTNWREGGYVDWWFQGLLLDAAGDFAATAPRFAKLGITTEQLLQVVMAHYATALTVWDGNVHGLGTNEVRGAQMALKGILALRRSEQNDRRLAIAEAKLDLLRAKQSSSLGRAKRSEDPSSSSSIPPILEPTAHLRNSSSSSSSSSSSDLFNPADSLLTTSELTPDSITPRIAASPSGLNPKPESEDTILQYTTEPTLGAPASVPPPQSAAAAPTAPIISTFPRHHRKSAKQHRRELRLLHRLEARAAHTQTPATNLSAILEPEAIPMTA